MRQDCTSGTPHTCEEFGQARYPECPDTPLTFLSINFCNIRGLRSNFPSVEHHLSSTKPHLRFLTETQVCEATDSSPFSVPFPSILIFDPKLDVASMSATT